MLWRWLIILAHKFDWHYAPVFGPLIDEERYRYQRWCQWCGFRESYNYDPHVGPKPVVYK